MYHLPQSTQKTECAMIFFILFCKSQINCQRPTSVAHKTVLQLCARDVIPHHPDAGWPLTNLHGHSEKSVQLEPSSAPY